MKKFYSLTIGWFYPDLMSTYGDRGNIIVLQKRLQLRGIKTTIKKISIYDSSEIIKKCDLFFMGGAQDRQQEIVNRDLLKQKGKFLIKAIEKDIPALFICGAYQFMGRYYKTAEGVKLQGLGLFDIYTENPGTYAKRLIGDVIIEPNDSIFKKNKPVFFVGFENHGGRTYLFDQKRAFAKVIKGYGNNGIDKTEGFIYHNAIGTYLHGPILPKNPELTDWLLQKALEIKYKEQISLKKITDFFSESAKKTILRRFSV